MIIFSSYSSLQGSPLGNVWVRRGWTRSSRVLRGANQVLYQWYGMMILMRDDDEDDDVDWDGDDAHDNDDDDGGDDD